MSNVLAIGRYPHRETRSFKYGEVFFSDTNSMSFILAQIKPEDVSSFLQCSLMEPFVAS